MRHLLFFLSLLLPFGLFGFDFTSVRAEYDVSYGIIGNIGEVEASLKLESGTYKMQIRAEGKGLSKFFSKNRVEVYESTGIVHEGKLIPTLFVKNRTWGDKEERKRYFFHHDKKEVVVVQTNVDGGKVNESTKHLPYYAENDILTLFFNLKYLIGESLTPKGQQQLFAVGADKKDGHLSIEKPVGKRYQALKKLLGVDDHILIVILHQKLFSSKNGELFINITKEGLCNRVVLKDVLFYGDLVGKIKNLEIDK